jgi:DNA helicase IV
MQCRAIARRSEHGSLTVLGDLAQGTAPWASADWRTSLRHLGRPHARVVPLTVGFRVPAAVLALANRLLPALAVSVPESVSLRQHGTLDIHQVTDLATATVDHVTAALALEGSVAVICADAAVPAIQARLHDAGLVRRQGASQRGTSEERTGPNPSGSVPAESTLDDPDSDDDLPDEPRVTVLPASLAKGLEYDHVVVLEPAQIVRAEPRGLHRLYVVLTRAVSRLTVLHSQPLPL